MERRNEKLIQIRGERVRIILREQNLKQVELADRLGVAPLTVLRWIHKDVKKAHLLGDQDARKIIEEFPEYRLQWLLGYDDIKTVAEYKRHEKIQESAKSVAGVYTASALLINEAFVRKIDEELQAGRVVKKGIPDMSNMDLSTVRTLCESLQGCAREIANAYYAALSSK